MNSIDKYIELLTDYKEAYKEWIRESEDEGESSGIAHEMLLHREGYHLARAVNEIVDELYRLKDLED